MYLHILYDYTNYVCIENKYVNDEIAHKLISAGLLFLLQNLVTLIHIDTLKRYMMCI